MLSPAASASRAGSVKASIKAASAVAQRATRSDATDDDAKADSGTEEDKEQRIQDEIKRLEGRYPERKGALALALELGKRELHPGKDRAQRLRFLAENNLFGKNGTGKPH